MIDATNQSLDDWAFPRYKASVARGEHDALCEQGPGYYLCHCRKRARLASGPTEPLGELIYQCPMCPGCGMETAPDGDGGWDCTRCHAHFGEDMKFSYYDDDFGGETLQAPRGRWVDLGEVTLP